MHRHLPFALVLPFALAAVVAVDGTAGRAGAQTPPIVAHWMLDETSGTTAFDIGPFANVGALVNVTGTAWVPGQLGNALQLDGVDDYVQIASNGGLPLYDGLGTPLTVTFWVKAAAQSDRRVYSEQAAAPANSGPLFTLGSGSGDAVAMTKLRVFVRTDEVQNVVNVLSNAVVFDDTWHHVAYVDVAGRARIYVDGVLDTAFDYSHWNYGPLSTLRGTFAALNSATLGAVVRNGAVATPLAGAIDDVRLYRCALTAPDVQAVRFGGLPALCAASLGSFGVGCGGGPLELVATGNAQRGTTVWLQLVRGTPGSIAALCIGTGVLSPLDLTSFGFAGCTLYNQGCAGSLFGVIGAPGSSNAFALAIPNNPSLDCLLVNVQGVTLGAGLEFSTVAIAHVGS